MRESRKGSEMCVKMRLKRKSCNSKAEEVCAIEKSPLQGAFVPKFTAY